MPLNWADFDKVCSSFTNNGSPNKDYYLYIETYNPDIKLLDNMKVIEKKLI